MRSIIAIGVAVGCALAAVPAATARADDDFVALAVSVASGRAAGWGTGSSQDQANQIALTHCAAEAGDVCQVVAGARNGCASVAFDRLSGITKNRDSGESALGTVEQADFGTVSRRVTSTHPGAGAARPCSYAVVNQNTVRSIPGTISVTSISPCANRVRNP